LRAPPRQGAERNDLPERDAQVMMPLGAFLRQVHIDPVVERLNPPFFLASHYSSPPSKEA
jgi:hypothetical protein